MNNGNSQPKKSNPKLQETLGALLLLLTAIIWGLAFVAQSKGMESVGPFTFNGVRSFVGAIVLIPVLAINRHKIFKVYEEKKTGSNTGADSEKDRTETAAKPDGNETVAKPDGNETPAMTEITDPKKRLTVLLTGLLSIGLVFFMASQSQQIGIGLTDSVGKAGFITALYIVLVPVAGIFMKKRPNFIVYLCVAASTVGLYLLCMKKGEGFHLQVGDIFLIACAVLFTGHILLIDYFSQRINGVLIAVTQFFAVGVLCSIGMIFFEKPTFEQIKSAALPILYAGALSSGVGYTFQILGQKYVEPTKASLIMCLESVFSVLGGFLILHQTLSLREGIGCVIMFAAILVCQIFGQKSFSKGT